MGPISREEREALLGAENDSVLRVKASSAPSSVASAITHAIQKDEKVVLRAIGAGAVNQGVKAVAIANSYLGQTGITLALIPGFTSTKSTSGEDLSVMVFRIIII